MTTQVRSRVCVKPIEGGLIQGLTTVDIVQDDLQAVTVTHAATWEAGKDSSMLPIKAVVAVALSKMKRVYQRVVFGCVKQGWVGSDQQVLYSEMDVRWAIQQVLDESPDTTKLVADAVLARLQTLIPLDGHPVEATTDEPDMSGGDGWG